MYQVIVSDSYEFVNVCKFYFDGNEIFFYQSQYYKFDVISHHSHKTSERGREGGGANFVNNYTCIKDLRVTQNVCATNCHVQPIKHDVYKTQMMSRVHFVIFLNYYRFFQMSNKITIFKRWGLYIIYTTIVLLALKSRTLVKTNSIKFRNVSAIAKSDLLRKRNKHFI